MTRRVVVGQRPGGDFGIFASPPGVDALTAAANQLNLNMSVNATQILQRGFVVGFPQTIALGLSHIPFLLIIPITSNPSIGLPLFVRPAPTGFLSGNVQAAVGGGGANFTISGVIGQARYMAFRQATSL